LAEEITAAFKTPRGKMKLRPRQAFALTELYDYRGLFGMLPVGDGKTLISLLAPRVLGAKRPLLLVPASLRVKTLEFDIPFYEQHWRLPENLTVLSYSMLSSESQAEVLFDLMPDLVICDEVHKLRNRKAARTRRFLRYFARYPDTVFAALSGTMTKRSLKDYWHLIRLTHGPAAPVPLHYSTLCEWADAVDADVDESRRVAPGALLDFCEEGENVRQGFRRRLIETPGVVASRQSGFGDEPEPGIVVRELRTPEPPESIVSAMSDLRATWRTPSGEELTDGISLWRHAGSLALGFYLRWVWPCPVHDECPSSCDERVPDDEWLGARRDWKRYVREVLKHNRSGLDSELQVWNACESGERKSGEWAAWSSIRDRHGRQGPPTEVVWVDDWFVGVLARDVVEIGEPTLVWTRTPALGERLAAALDCRYYGAGDDGVITETSTCVVSVQSHGEGKNLQAFGHNVFVACPLGGSEWQQAMGRTHRPGQKADEVSYLVYLHCREFMRAFRSAQVDARYIEDTTGDPQKLNKATVVVRDPREVEALERSGDPLWTA